MPKEDLDLANKIIQMPRQIVCTYWEDKKVHTVGIDIGKDEHITVLFEKGYVVVKTEKETKFVCKGIYFLMELGEQYGKKNNRN